jgi:ATP-binding cassette subfamily B protein
MIKTLMKSIREYKKASILSIILIVFEAAIECALPFVTSKLVDQMNDSNNKLLIIYSIVLIIMAMLSLLFGALAGKYSAMAAAGFAKNLRKDMFEAISNYSFENIDKFQTSSLVTRMTTDVTNVQNAYIQIIRGAIRSPLMIIFSLIMSFTIAPQLAWIFVVVLVSLSLILSILMVSTMGIFRRVFKKYDKLNDSVEENINGIRVVKSFVREDYEIEKFNKASDGLKKDFTIVERIIGMASPLMTAAVNIIMVFILFLGTSIIVKNSEAVTYVTAENGQIVPVAIYHDLTIGQFQSLMTYGFQSLVALIMLQMVIIMIVMAIESAKRIVEVLDEVSTLKNPENPIYEINDGSIKFNNVSFKYSEKAQKYALSNINLEIKSGETVGIIGGTGSSKTSLVNLISRLYDVSDGELIVAGNNVKNYDLNTLRNNVAVVLQKNLLFTGTIKDNLKWGKADATDEEIKEACKLACADEFIESFPDKYDTHITQGGTNVSGGQKQRLCIARALLKHPKILILDDSTSAVDTKTDAIIRKGFKKFIPETTKIIIAQRISSIQDADKIIIMDNGEINAIGTHDELLKSNEIYQEVYYTQNKSTDEPSKEVM